MDTRKTEFERFEQALEQIRAAFPSLRIEIARDHQHVEALADIPRQAGLDFDVGINLQNADELHLTAGSHFWVEWFPCGDQEVFDQFVTAAKGVISGEYRIVESYALGRAVTAQLQRPNGRGWESVTGWGNLGCLVPLPRNRKILRNTSGPSAAG